MEYQRFRIRDAVRINKNAIQTNGKSTSSNPNPARLASPDSEWPRFSHTSVKYLLLPAASTLGLKLTGRQTRHTQWFARHSWDWDGPHVRFIQAHPIRGAPWRIAKRYVCAAKSIRALLIMFRTRPADSPNATCVRPTRFLPWRQVATLFSGPINGRETLRT